jgi:Lipase (class 3)
MPITDKDIAELCLGIYTYPGTITWDHYDSGADSDEICWGVKVVEGTDVLVFRGSITFEDWRRDFDVWTNPFGHLQLGPVHPGFLLGVDQVLAEYRQAAKGPLFVAGHSLGAGRASVLCGLAIVAGVTPIGRVVFGEPRPGFAQLADLIKPISHSLSYRNGKPGTFEHDLVTDVPYYLGLYKYVHPTALVDVSALPPLLDEWGIFSYHHMQLYLQAISGQGPLAS